MVELLATTALATPVRVYAAGSLMAPMKEIIAASGLPADAVAVPVFGPAGLLRQRIEGGEPADLFASADMAGPTRLADAGLGLPPVPFAFNRMCVIGKQSLGLRDDNLLDRLLAPAVRLATSTPGADPGGDYAEAVFDRAEAIRPGAKALFEAKALRLFGGPNGMAPVNGMSPGGSILLGDRADALLYYCSGAAQVLREVPGLVSVPVGGALEVVPVYGLTVLGNNPDAMRLALFMLSARGSSHPGPVGLSADRDAVAVTACSTEKRA